MLKVTTHLAKCTIICAIYGTLVACGTKGPLYIPEQRYPQEVEQPASPDASIPNTEKAPDVAPIETLPTVKDY
ncbi:MAG: lipoprotein [Pseudomonadota bacterium]